MKIKARKKSILTIISAIMAAAIFFIVGCAGYSAIRVENPQEHFNYLVTGNGTMAVQFGPYIYFINGTRGNFADDDADQNRWGEVVQGGIYRARLQGDSNRSATPNATLDTFNNNRWSPSINESQEHGGDESRFRLDMLSRDDDRTFTYGNRNHLLQGDYREENEDLINENTQLPRAEFSRRSDVVNTVLIAPKTIGTSVHSGLWIFGQNIFFASPNNRRDRGGNVRYDQTDFFVMGLDGSNPTRIFTTTGSASNLPFVFHYVAGNVYLFASYTNEDNLVSIVAVRIELRANRSPSIGTPAHITEIAQEVFMPTRYEFNRHDNSVILEDFIYYTRPARREHGDTHNDGNIVFAVRPSGNGGRLDRDGALDSFSFFETGFETQVLNIRDNKLFYSREVDGVTHARFTNLHNLLLAGSSTYLAYYNSVPENHRRYFFGQLGGYVYREFNSESYVFVYFFGASSAGNLPNNAGYVLTIGENGVQIVSYVDTQFRLGAWTVIPMTAAGGTPEFAFLRDSYLYFTEHDSFFRIHIFNRGTPQLLSGEHTLVRSGNNLNVGFVANHAIFFSSFDRWTQPGTGYTFFSDLDRPQDAPFFVGARDERDIPDDYTWLNYLRGIEPEYEDPDDGDEW